MGGRCRRLTLRKSRLQLRRYAPCAFKVALGLVRRDVPATPHASHVFFARLCYREIRAFRIPYEHRLS